MPLNLPSERPAWVTPVIATGASLFALLLVGSLPGLVRRRQRRRALADGSAAALWDELAATARDLGFPWLPSATPRQIARRLAELVRGAEPGEETGAAGRRVRRPDSTAAAIDAIRRLALAEEAASYGRPGSPAATGPLAPALRGARRGLLRAVPRRTRVRARLWPASLMSGWYERASIRLAALARRPVNRLPRPGRRATRAA